MLSFGKFFSSTSFFALNTMHLYFVQGACNACTRVRPKLGSLIGGWLHFRVSVICITIINTRKYDRGLHYTMRHDLHWLGMTDRVQFRIATTVYRCLHGMAPEYISELCFPVKLRPSRYQLQSSQSNQLIVPPVKLSTYGPRSFAVAGPTIWSNLPEYLRDPELSIDNFRRHLKTFLFAQY